jgi:hypothetical protein
LLQSSGAAETREVVVRERRRARLALARPESGGCRIFAWTMARRMGNEREGVERLDDSGEVAFCLVATKRLDVFEQRGERDTLPSLWQKVCGKPS